VNVSRRTERLGEMLRDEIARVLRARSADPRLRLVTLTRVEVARDLATARVYWSRLGEDDPEALARVEEALVGAAGFLRRELAAALSLRRTPALEFRHDPSGALGARTLALLRGVRGGPAG
jgi:ribosome-binding factor A